MALAVSVTFNFVDSKGKTSTTKIRVPTGFSVAQYTEFAIAAAQLLTNGSLAKITSVSFAVGVDLSGATIRSAAQGAADIAQKMLIVIRSSISGLFARLNIPTANEAKVLDSSDAFDTSDSAIAALITALEDGISVPLPTTGTVTVTPRDRRENPLDTVSEVRETFRRI